MPVVPLAGLPAGTLVLIDANIFVYAFRELSTECERFLERCRAQQVFGATTLEVVNDVCHRLMLAEALDEGLIGRPAAAALAGKRDAIRRLHRYWPLTIQIFEMNIAVLALQEARVRRAHTVRTSYGLLTTDSLLVAAAEENSIENLVTLDSDFDRIPGLTVYKPTDLS
ncbi:MAG: type II toxin-antitoxin system VapC family toxin [Candidatus Binataceae bacterium]|nr:type II toxin-antitoxin system VapC family toxin [Candidatus Binataceae bacterium]